MRLKGEKLHLRDLRFADLDTVHEFMHPSQEWHKLDAPYYPPSPIEELPSVMAKWAQKIAEEPPKPRFRLAIAHAETDKIMGIVSRYWISEETDWAALGIAIWNPEHWGKGYGYEALGLWAAYLFASDSRFVRLDLRTWSGNVGMMKVAEKLGFRQEAVFRKARIVNGRYYDGLGYGILREEWQGLHPDNFLSSAS